MTNTEIWNYLVNEYQAHRTAPESEIQTLWEDYLSDAELFGYSKVRHEVDRWRRLHIGSTDRAIPDIVLRKDDKDICVIELKQLSLARTADFEKQLLSYLTHPDLHISLGILICQALYVYSYNYSDNKSVCLKINFEKYNELGIQLVALLSKNNFDSEEITDFVLENADFVNTVHTIRSQLSDELLKSLVKQYFEQSYDTNLVDSALSNFSFSCEPKRQKTHVNLQSNNYQSSPVHIAGTSPEIVYQIGDRIVDAMEFKEHLLQVKFAERTWIYANDEERIDYWDAKSFKPTSGLSNNVRSTNHYRSWKTTGLIKVICKIRGVIR